MVTNNFGRFFKFFIQDVIDEKGDLKEIFSFMKDREEKNLSDNEKKAWQEFFTSHFLMNSHYGFEYLNDLTEKNSNIIDEEQAEYMSYSLTGVKSDFTFAEPLDYNNASSFFNDAYLESYTSEMLDDGVLVHAVITTISTTIENDEPVVSNTSYNADVKLVNNSSSCFDGYSISSLKCIQ